MKIKMEVIIDYDMNDEPFAAVSDQLMWAMDHLCDCGLLNGDLNADVLGYELVITEVEEVEEADE